VHVNEGGRAVVGNVRRPVGMMEMMMHSHNQIIPNT
jgi:hypothetical protein